VPDAPARMPPLLPSLEDGQGAGLRESPMPSETLPAPQTATNRADDERGTAVRTGRDGVRLRRLRPVGTTATPIPIAEGTGGTVRDSGGGLPRGRAQLAEEPNPGPGGQSPSADGVRERALLASRGDDGVPGQAVWEARSGGSCLNACMCGRASVPILGFAGGGDSSRPHACGCPSVRDDAAASRESPSKAEPRPHSSLKDLVPEKCRSPVKI